VILQCPRDLLVEHKHTHCYTVSPFFPLQNPRGAMQKVEVR